MKCRVALLVLTLTGCAVGPNYQQPDLASSLPSRYSEAAEPGQFVDRWWTTFNDAAINQLVDSALARNLDITAANAIIRQARAQLGINDSATKPQLKSSARAGRDLFSKNSEQFANIPIQNPQINFPNYHAQLDASWEIDLFGMNARNVEATKARLSSAEFQHDAVALRVAAEVARNVIDYRTYQLRAANAEGVLSDSKELLALLTLQKKAGLISESELTDAQTATSNAAANIPPLHAAAWTALIALTVLTDQSQEQVSTVLNLATGIPAAKINAIGLPSDLLRRRPDLRSAERELAAATADIGVAVAAQYPQLNLVATGGLDSISPGKFTELASRFWNVGPQLTLPIYAGGRLAAQVDMKEAARDAALANYRQKVLSAFADTETALIRFQREQQRLNQLNDALTTQRRQFEFAQTRYQLGDTPYINVLQSRQQLAQYNDQQLVSTQLLAENLTLLFKSMGGGYQ